MTIPNDLIGSNHKSSVMPQDLRAIHCKECPQKKMWYSQDLNMKALEDHCGSHHRGQTVETQFLLKCRLCRSQFTPAQSSKWSEHCKNDHQDSQKLSKVVVTFYRYDYMLSDVVDRLMIERCDGGNDLQAASCRDTRS